MKKLGFGLMRLPVRSENPTDIDQETFNRMVDRFLEQGFTYFDTSYVYHNGASETAIREALVKRHERGSFVLASKFPTFMMPDEAQAEGIFHEQLEKCGVEFFDYYLLHNVNRYLYATEIQNARLFEHMKAWKEQGKIRHIAFSYHDDAAHLDQILTEHPEVEAVQIALNYYDWEEPFIQARKCYEVIRKHGAQVIVMEPVKGGMLANPPEAVQEVFRQAEPGSSAASWGIRFAANLEGVITVLSGMSSVEQMKDNLSYMKDFHGLTPKQEEIIQKAQEELKKIPLIPCTTCNYCAKVCPKNIGISGSFTAMNLLTLYRDLPGAKHQEEWLVGGHGKARADECVKCGKCEEACPQHIRIRENLEKVCEALLK